ncbi:TonB-dependent receptor [Pontibacter sp. JH31]|uniref:TonB-dependent receptor n=1 Tax=Pontibacter aquaedesilientis TaxID=2766980 RepID=A0ABR7XIU1_9BACT|nr:TonB-dependent receptor [Pontibacter aquaedesilientis]MBD1397331.1 TonB-dependent receptor [Pontibacter aquaedesilientis]
MKKIYLLLFALFAVTQVALAQSGSVKGRVLGADSREPLNGATVLLEGTTKGASTNAAGDFSIVDVPAGTYNLRISYVGYTFPRQSVTVNAGSPTDIGTVTMITTNMVGEEIVVTASRRPEKLTEAPATISLISSRDIAELPSFNVGELLARQKGVEFIRTGVLGTGINVRGLNSAFNPKNLQMNDARLSTLIATGLPLGPLGTVVKEDIERIEVVLGPAAALYGPNAHNGLVNTITKDPRRTEGTTLALGAGNQQVFSGRFRHAQVISPKMAFKVTGEYTKGLDFAYNDTVYFGAKQRATEIDLDRKFNTMRGEAAMYYSVNNASDIIVSYGGSNSNNLAQTNAGRNQIKDWQVHYLHTRYVSPRVFAQVYHTWSKTDDTYAINQRTQNYLSFKNAGFSEEEARSRSYKEQWFGSSPAAGVALPRGAVFKDASRRLNGELQYNNSIGGFDFIVGSQYQRDIADSRNTYLFDRDGAIVVDQLGFYGQIEKQLGGGFKALVAGRGDNHEFYGFNFIPKAALVWAQNDHAIRLTYGKGIAAPTILNLEGYLFGGLLIGNGQGYTLSDGTKINKLEVESINTLETGYKGKLSDMFFLDVNAYYNKSKNFLSPAINIATQGRKVTQRGDVPMSQVIPGTPEAGAAFLLTYVNFGEVDTYGADFGLTFAPLQSLNFVANYSYFGYNIDKDDLNNDGNRDGKVNQLDLSINAPANRFSLAANYSKDKFFGSIFTRWVQEFDFFSGINVAAKADEALGLKENARFGRTWNYGPLGGFTNVDVSAGYRFNTYLTASAQVTNVFNAEVREFVASPFIGRLYSVELKVNLPGFSKKTNEVR